MICKRFISKLARSIVDLSDHPLGCQVNVHNLHMIMDLFVHAMTVHERPWTIKDLYNDYIDGYPELENESVVQHKTFSRLALLISHTLALHRFKDAQEYRRFLWRAVIMSPEVVFITNNLSVERSVVLECVNLLKDDEGVASKVHWV